MASAYLGKSRSSIPNCMSGILADHLVWPPNEPEVGQRPQMHRPDNRQYRHSCSRATFRVRTRSCAQTPPHIPQLCSLTNLLPTPPGSSLTTSARAPSSSREAGGGRALQPSPSSQGECCAGTFARLSLPCHINCPAFCSQFERCRATRSARRLRMSPFIGDAGARGCRAHVAT